MPFGIPVQACGGTGERWEAAVPPQRIGGSPAKLVIAAMLVIASAM
jgi:hypothetical protein